MQHEPKDTEDFATVIGPKWFDSLFHSGGRPDPEQVERTTFAVGVDHSAEVAEDHSLFEDEDTSETVASMEDHSDIAVKEIYAAVRDNNAAKLREISLLQWNETLCNLKSYFEETDSEILRGTKEISVDGLKTGSVRLDRWGTHRDFSQGKDFNLTDYIGAMANDIGIFTYLDWDSAENRMCEIVEDIYLGLLAIDEKLKGQDDPKVLERADTFATVLLDNIRVVLKNPEENVRLKNAIAHCTLALTGTPDYEYVGDLIKFDMCSLLQRSFDLDGSYISKDSIVGLQLNQTGWQTSPGRYLTFMSSWGRMGKEVTPIPNDIRCWGSHISFMTEEAFKSYGNGEDVVRASELYEDDESNKVTVTVEQPTDTTLDHISEINEHMIKLKLDTGKSLNLYTLEIEKIAETLTSILDNSKELSYLERRGIRYVTDAVIRNLLIPIFNFRKCILHGAEEMVRLVNSIVENSKKI